MIQWVIIRWQRVNTLRRGGGGALILQNNYGSSYGYSAATSYVNDAYAAFTGNAGTTSTSAMSYLLSANASNGGSWSRATRQITLFEPGSIQHLISNLIRMV